MRLEVLGCSGGIGGDCRTTAFLLDSDILIDAGTGVTELSFADLAKIDHVFVTHSHLDHVASIPWLVDTVGSIRREPLVVHATDATIRALRNHIFNWKIWPDFTQIPTEATPYLRFESLPIGVAWRSADRVITAIPANHVVPAVGYYLDSGDGGLIFSGDTTSNDALWECVNAVENLRYLIIETAFPNRDRHLAIASKHLCPSLLDDELHKLRRDVQVFISHLKPSDQELIMQEIGQLSTRVKLQRLMNRQVLVF